MRRLITALLLYAIFAAAAFVLLTKERLYIVLIVLFALAFRTLIAYKAGWTISTGDPSQSGTDVSERNPD